MMENVMIMAVMAELSRQDIKKRSVPLWQLVVFFIIAIGHMLWLKTWQGSFGKDSFLGGIIGLCILFLCCLTKKLGEADGIVCICIGILFGSSGLITIFFGAVYLMGIICVILVALKIINVNYEMPFIPFISAAMLCYMIFK